MNIVIDKEKLLFSFVAICILSSPGLSYSILYPYHIVLPIIGLLIFSKFINNDFLGNKFTLYLSIFFLYCCFSCFFLKNYDLYFNYLIYIFISFSCMVYIYNFMVYKENSSFVFKMFLVYFFIMLFIAFFESLNIFRLPFSPYSQYYGLFGKKLDVSEWSDSVFTYNTQKPTVFSGNPNTFGYVFLCYFPFLYLLKNKIIKTLCIVVSLFIIYKIDSKMLFLTFILFFIIKYILLSKRRFGYIVFLIFSLLLLYPMLAFLQNSNIFETRMFTAFDELSKGIDYIFGNSLDDQMDSTGERAYIYSLGIEKFKDTYGIGMGLSGIESFLLNFFGKHTAFHNFFLMVLVDLGVIGFLIVISFYCFLFKNLYLGFIKYRISYLGRVYEAFLIGLLISVIASITPSGIIYLLPYWFFIGAASFMAFNVKRFERNI